MKKIRFEKDIAIKWHVTTNGEEVPLTGRNLTLVLTDPTGRETELDYNIEDDCVISAGWYGKDHCFYGKHILTVFDNRGREGSTALDCVDFVDLVPYTIMEGDAPDPALEIETLSLEGDLQYGQYISDLEEIRAGAALGATSVQPGEFNEAMLTKQDVIPDLETIRTNSELAAHDAPSIAELISVAYQVSASASPSAAENNTKVTLSASLKGFNGKSVPSDEVVFTVGGTEYVGSPTVVTLSGATSVGVKVKKGTEEYSSTINVGGYKYIYWGVGNSAADVKAQNQYWRTSGSSANKSGGYAAQSSATAGQYFYFLIPSSGITAPSKFKLGSTDGQEFPCTLITTETVSGFKIYKSNREIAVNQSFTVFAV